MKSLFRVICFIAAGVCIIFGLSRLGRGEEDSELKTALSGEYAYLKERQIGEVFGYHASEYWRIVVHNGDPAQWERVKEASLTFGIKTEMDQQVNAALALGFSVPADSKRDRRIKEEWFRLASRVPELQRRQAFPQRMKDCLAACRTLASEVL